LLSLLRHFDKNLITRLSIPAGYVGSSVFPKPDCLFVEKRVGCGNSSPNKVLYRVETVLQYCDSIRGAFETSECWAVVSHHAKGRGR
jgi:hypothetical protein